jgi:hypothetical protein
VRSKTILAIAAICISAAEARAETGYDNLSCYVWSDTLPPLAAAAPGFAFEDIALTGTAVVLADDSSTPLLPLGFSFELYGVAYSALAISSNGLLSFTGITHNDAAPSPFPRAETPNAVIAAYWADLDPSSGGAVHFELRGTAPARRFIVQYTEVPFYPGAGSATFQTILYEGTNEIVIAYQKIETGAAHYRMSAGIENAAGSEHDTPPAPAARFDGTWPQTPQPANTPALVPLRDLEPSLIALEAPPAAEADAIEAATGCNASGAHASSGLTPIALVSVWLCLRARRAQRRNRRPL